MNLMTLFVNLIILACLVGFGYWLVVLLLVPRLPAPFGTIVIIIFVIFCLILMLSLFGVIGGGPYFRVG
jgi:hypothetical protein